MQVSKISFQNQHYPDTLRELHNPPKELYVVGALPDPNRRYIAIVGTRSYTPYGKSVTYDLALELARAGWVIVSGLALGIDSFAHRGALDAGGLTMAVLPCGPDQIYPRSHAALAEEIVAHGGSLITELAPGAPTYKQQFVARNRIVTGLCEAVVITESKAQGGAMRTAQFALDQGKTVLAVPGDITRITSAGTNNLIRSGATPVTSSTDILQALHYDTGSIPASVVSAQNPHEARIVELLQAGTNRNDGLIAGTGLAAAEFASVISLMEITGKVRNLGAGQWAAR